MLAQTDVRAIEALERIATSQIIMAVAILLVGLVVIAGTGYFFMQIRALRAAIRENLDDVKPRVIPLIDRAKSVTDDVAGMTDNVRKVDDVLHTLEDLRRALEEGGEAAQKRVRRFGKVLDVVQSETEDLLLDAAAAARGVHATTRMLRRGRKPRRLLKRRRRPKGED